MYKSNMNHYLLRQASCEEMHIFHKKIDGICVRTRKGNSAWSTISTIKSEVHDNFCVSFDDKHNPAILCQNRYGDIILLQLRNRQWISSIVQKSTSLNRYNKNPFLVRCGQDLMMFYRALREGKNYLSCRNINNNEMEHGLINIDQIDESGKIYRVVSCNDLLIVFYSRKDENILQPGYRVYHDDTGKWDDFTSLPELKSKAAIIEGYSDGVNIHSLWKCNKADKVQYLYYRYNVSQQIWQEPKILLELTNPVQTCSVFSCNENLILYWIIHNTIYFRLSVDNGETWSNAEMYLFDDGEDYYKIKYLGINKDGKENKCTVPGTFNGGCRVAFIDSEQSGEDNKLNMLSGRLLEMRILPRQISSMEQDLNELEAKYNTLIEKLQLLENELKTHMSKSAEQEKVPKMNNTQDGTNKSDKEVVTGSTVNNPCEDSANIPKCEKPLMPGVGFSNITIQFLDEINSAISQ